MAEDGTMRGGVRIGAGRKGKSTAEKILDGQLPNFNVETLNENFSFQPPKEYLLAEQKGGGLLCAEQIYSETYKWLQSVGCDKIVTKQLIEDFAMTKARHIQCEEILSKFGLLAKHPTTGEPTTSPFVKMSIDYMKQSCQLWYQIYSVVKEHNAKGQIGLTEQSAKMDELLRRVK